MEDNYEEFNKILHKSLDETNDPLWRKRRVDSVAGYSWDKRLSYMLEKIEEVYYKN
jgi:hypothetical protein